MSTTNEFIYFNSEYNGKGDFSGSEAAFNADERIAFLRKYASFLEKRYNLQNGSVKAVKSEQVKQGLQVENLPPETLVRKTLYIDEMQASAKPQYSACEGWQFYTARAFAQDGCVIFNDNYMQPVPCAKYDIKDGETLKSIQLQVYVAGDYEIQSMHDNLEKSPLDIATGRIIELRGGLSEILKIQFYADGRAFALVGNADKYHHAKIFIGKFSFNAWNEVEINLKECVYAVRLNDGITSNLAYTETAKPDALFFSGGRHPVGAWKVRIRKLCFQESEQTEFFIPRKEQELEKEELGNVKLPYKIGGYVCRDKCLILRKEFMSENADCAILTIDTLDPAGEVYINGKKVCETDGFMRQRIDIKKTLADGKNLLEIVVFPRAPEILYPWHRCTDVYNAWVCGKVKIDFCSQTHIKAIEAFTEKTTPTVQAKITVQLNRKTAGTIKLFMRPTYPAFGTETEIYQGEIKGQKIAIQTKINAYVWTCENPYLYTLRAQIENESGEVLDDCVTETGFRTVKQKDGAIYLNGEKTVLKGALVMQFLAPYENICKSHVCPTNEEIVWQLCALKNMNGNTARLHMLGYGTNDSRIAYYADRLGIMLIWTTRWIDSVESVQWTSIWKQSQAYVRQIQEVINHPSIIMWEGSNELHAGKECTDRLYDEFVSAVKCVDSTRLLSPCSHLYYGGGLYGNEGFYYQDDGKFDQDFMPTESSFGWNDPLVVRSAHTYEIMLGYGGDWKTFREQAWSSQDALFNSKKHAYLVSEIAIIGRHDDTTEECATYVKSDSYELKDEKLALGGEIEQSDWKISQAYQALSAQHIAKSLLSNDVDGILWCCLSGGANDGSYFKPPIDFYGYAKFAFYVLKESFAKEIAFNDDTAVAVGTGFEIKPMLSQLLKGATYDFRITIKDVNGNVVAATEYNGLVARGDRMRLSTWKPVLEQNGYYQIEYTLERK